MEGRGTRGEAVKKIRASGKPVDVHGVAADLGTLEGVERFVKEVGSADILINNLGIFEPSHSRKLPCGLDTLF